MEHSLLHFVFFAVFEFFLKIDSGCIDCKPQKLYKLNVPVVMAGTGQGVNPTIFFIFWNPRMVLRRFCRFFGNLPVNACA